MPDETKPRPYHGQTHRQKNQRDEYSTWTDRSHPDSQSDREPNDSIAPDRPQGIQDAGKPKIQPPGVRWIRDKKDDAK